MFRALVSGTTQLLTPNTFGEPFVWGFRIERLRSMTIYIFLWMYTIGYTIKKKDGSLFYWYPYWWIACRVFISCLLLTLPQLSCWAGRDMWNYPVVISICGPPTLIDVYVSLIIIRMLCISYDLVYCLLYLVRHIYCDFYIYLLVDRCVWWCYSWCIGTEPFYLEEEATEEI